MYLRRPCPRSPSSFIPSERAKPNHNGVSSLKTHAHVVPLSIYISLLSAAIAAVFIFSRAIAGPPADQSGRLTAVDIHGALPSAFLDSALFSLALSPSRLLKSGFLPISPSSSLPKSSETREQSSPSLPVHQATMPLAPVHHWLFLAGSAPERTTTSAERPPSPPGCMRTATSSRSRSVYQHAPLASVLVCFTSSSPASLR